MLTPYDRIMRNYRMEARLEREQPRDEREIVSSTLIALVIAQAKREGR